MTNSLNQDAIILIAPDGKQQVKLTLNEWSDLKVTQGNTPVGKRGQLMAPRKYCTNYRLVTFNKDHVYAINSKFIPKAGQQVQLEHLIQDAEFDVVDLGDQLVTIVTYRLL